MNGTSNFGYERQWNTKWKCERKREGVKERKRERELNYRLISLSSLVVKLLELVIFTRTIRIILSIV